MLSILLATQDEQGQGLTDTVRDETLTLLTAGHGTTSIALMWTFYLLAQHPEVEACLRREIDAVLGMRRAEVSDLQQLPYLHAVFAEALRLYPPVWAQDREAVAELELGGYLVPKGAVVLVSQWVMQHDARFEEPAEFQPERWLGPTDTNVMRYTYFPFGLGPRVCIGEDYAWMNGLLILATIVQHWRLGLVPGQHVNATTLRAGSQIWHENAAGREKPVSFALDCSSLSSLARVGTQPPVQVNRNALVPLDWLAWPGTFGLLPTVCLAGAPVLLHRS